MNTKGFPLKGLSVDLKHSTWHWLVYDAGGYKPEPALFMVNEAMPGGGVWVIPTESTKLTAHEVFMKYRYFKPLEMVQEG